MAAAFLVGLALAGCSSLRPTPQPATVTVIFDLGGGGSGFAATIYAQEVSSGATGCAYAERCGDQGLLALDVEPGGQYEVYIADRSAPIPEADQPVDVL